MSLMLSRGKGIEVFDLGWPSINKAYLKEKQNKLFYAEQENPKVMYKFTRCNALTVNARSFYHKEITSSISNVVLT